MEYNRPKSMMEIFRTTNKNHFVSSKRFMTQGLLEIVISSDGKYAKKLKTSEKGKFLVDGLASELFVI